MPLTAPELGKLRSSPSAGDSGCHLDILLPRCCLATGKCCCNYEKEQNIVMISCTTVTSVEPGISLRLPTNTKSHHTTPSNLSIVFFSRPPTTSLLAAESDFITKRHEMLTQPAIPVEYLNLGSIHRNMSSLATSCHPPPGLIHRVSESPTGFKL